MTFEEALAEVQVGCNRADRLARIKVLLDATEEALFNSAIGGGVIEYRVDTGQTVVNVTMSSIASLRKLYESLLSTYNYMCQLATGSNVMICRNPAGM